MNTQERGNLPLFVGFRPDGEPTANQASDKMVARTIKAIAQAAGFNTVGFSGHSLRSGVLTTLIKHGAGLIPTMEHARHKSPITTMAYMRPLTVWDDNVTERFRPFEVGTDRPEFAGHRQLAGKAFLPDQVAASDRGGAEEDVEIIPPGLLD